MEAIKDEWGPVKRVQESTKRRSQWSTWDDVRVNENQPQRTESPRICEKSRVQGKHSKNKQKPFPSFWKMVGNNFLFWNLVSKGEGSSLSPVFPVGIVPQGNLQQLFMEAIPANKYRTSERVRRSHFANPCWKNGWGKRSSVSAKSTETVRHNGPPAVGIHTRMKPRLMWIRPEGHQAVGTSSQS